jgi:hypothetical protein
VSTAGGVTELAGGADPRSAVKTAPALEQIDLDNRPVPPCSAARRATTWSRSSTRATALPPSPAAPASASSRSPPQGARALENFHGAGRRVLRQIDAGGVETRFVARRFSRA